MTLSKYGRVFDKSCSHWANDRSYNFCFLKSMQMYFNDILKAKRHVFLKDVYEALGFPITKESVVVGWVLDENNPIGDNCIDFFLKDDDDKTNPDIEIDFNVDGYILDRI